MAIPVDPCQGGQDVGRGVCDQWCVVIGEQYAVALNKVEQVWHLLEVRRNVWVITSKVCVVELDIDNVLSFTTG